MSNVDTNNAAATSETIAALIAERDTLKSDLKASQEWVRKFATAALEIERLEEQNKELSVITAQMKAEQQRRKDEAHELELAEVTKKLLLLELAIQQFDPSGAALERYLDKAQELAAIVAAWKH